MCVLAHKLHTVRCPLALPRLATAPSTFDLTHTHTQSKKKPQLPAAAARVAQPHVGPRRRSKTSLAQQDVVSERQTWFSRNWRTKHLDTRLCCSVKKKEKKELSCRRRSSFVFPSQTLPQRGGTFANPPENRHCQDGVVFKHAKKKNISVLWCFSVKVTEGGGGGGGGALHNEWLQF